MGYPVPSLDETHRFLRALFRALLPSRNIGSTVSSAWRWTKAIAGAVTDNHANLDSVAKDGTPRTARGAALDGWIDVFAPGGSRTRKGATPARKSNAGRVRGVAGSPITEGDQLIHQSTGLSFQIGETTTVPVAGFIDVDIVAISTGSATRLQRGQTLKFVSTPTGLKREVELQLALDDDGFDAEQEPAARDRMLAAIREPQSGGNQSDYVAWAKSVTGIDHVFVYPNRDGIGSVDVAALHNGSGSSRALSGGERSALLAKLQALAPVTPAAPGGALRVLETVADTGGVDVTVITDGSAQFAWDWDDTGPAVIVLTYTSATRTMRFTTARPATMKAGDRFIVFGIASAQDGAPMVIESLSGLDSIVLQQDPPVAPVPTDRCYAAGPLTSIIHQAIKAHINGDTLYAGPDGPIPGQVAASQNIDVSTLNILIEGIGTANPDGKYGPWSGGLYRSAIATIVRYTRGVRNQDVVLPLTDQEAIDFEFPDGAKVGFFSFSHAYIRRG